MVCDVASKASEIYTSAIEKSATMKAKQPMKVSRTIARKNYVATKAATVDEKRRDRRRLLNVLGARISRNEVGQKEVRSKMKQIKGLDAQLTFLQTHVHTAPTPGRQPNPIRAGFKASKGTQVKGTPGAKTAQIELFCKDFQTKSLAAKRTLALYGFLRLLGAETTAPVPQLIRSIQKGQVTEFQFVHCGGDCRHKHFVTNEQYLAVRQKSIDELVALGVDHRAISHHKANWALTKSGASPYKACLIDVGRAVLSKGALKRIRDQLKSIERFSD